MEKYTIYFNDHTTIKANFNALTIENGYCSCINDDTKHQLLIPLTSIHHITDNTKHYPKSKPSSSDQLDQASDPDPLSVEPTTRDK